MKEEQRQERDELIKSIRNRCDIYLVLTKSDTSDVNGKDQLERLLPTILEDLYIDAQTLVYEFCVKER